MKKVFYLALLGVSISALAGCNAIPSDNTDAISKISFTGKMNKKHYKYEDSWDTTGLKVKATTKKGETSILDESEYKIFLSKKAPKNYSIQLQVTAQLIKDPSKTATVTYNDIVVDDEIFDAEAEIETYYKDCNLTLSSSNLMKELQRHSFNKHSYFVKYGETPNMLSKSVKDHDYEAPDLVPGEHKIEMFYTGNKTNYYIGTREHVWPCADSNGLWTHGKVDESTYIGGGSDLYHVRPCDSKVNTARGDAPYIDFDDSEFSSYKKYAIEVGDDGPYSLLYYSRSYTSGTTPEYADYVEPADEVKGDIARIVAYIYMHYNTNGGTVPSKYSSMVGYLDLTKIIGYSTGSKARATLKKWNEMDPVSEVEARRNHTVQQIQGNRNPFVDYPELIDEVF